MENRSEDAAKALQIYILLFILLTSIGMEDLTETLGNPHGNGKYIKGG